MTTSNQPKPLAEAVRDGRLAGLRALRDSIAGDLIACEQMRDKAALYKRLEDVLQQIEALEPSKAEGDSVDEIAARRAARRAGTTKGSGRAQRTS